ncbi:MAG: FAD-binding oxidoreductase [Myxococcaceae bacterium]|nr:FAD-binding oxidoreductase [Myxococcaceae bacterium]
MIATVDVHALPPARREVLAAERDLSAAVSGRFSTRSLDRLSYARDLWPLALVWIREGRIPPPPDAIVWPGADDEVAALIMRAREHRLPVIPFGAGSGVCGGTVAVRGGLALDLKRFDRIGPVDPRARTVEVGAGVLGETLERRLEARGWTLGHFPSSIATSTVGGWLAARSAGQCSSRYGKIEDMVLSVRGVFGTGERFTTPERPFAGPDLAQLLLGSEGTLCAFTSAVLRVHPRPEARFLRAFDFPSVEVGLEAIRRLFREGLRPAVVRLYDPFDTAFVGRSNDAAGSPTPPSRRDALGASVVPAFLRTLAAQTLGRPRLVNPLAHLARRARLVLMFEGEAKACEADDAAAAASCRLFRGTDLGESPARHWYQNRYAVNFKLPRLMEAGTFVDTFECSAPWDRVLDVYERVRAAASAHALVLCHFSHAYADGCSLYFSFVGAASDAQATEARYQRLWRNALGAALSAGANVSHHHGIGLLKAREYQDSLGEGRHVLAALKRHLDPDGIMNPGKLGL